MKIGIMSMQRIINYGSFLQAYGLKKIIENLGHNVEFVDYLIEPPVVADVKQRDNSQFKRIYNLFKIIFSCKYRKKRNYDIKQNSAFSSFYRRFENEWLPILGVTKENNYLPELDTLVIGSDEVFNCTQPGDKVGYSLQLFGKDHKADKLISYAASFGSTTFEKLEKYGKQEEIGNLLNKFSAISVRDNNSHKIVEKLTNKSISDNIDPVLLYDFEDEVNHKIDLENYVVVYAYSGRISETEAKAIQSFAHKHNKKTLSIGIMQAFTDEYVCVEPFEMLSYIKNADYIITDTFHGTVFSIKYQIPFATIIRESNKEKLTDLLDKFALSGRRVNSLEDLEKIAIQPMNKYEIKEKIESYQMVAKKYLEENL